MTKRLLLLLTLSFCMGSAYVQNVAESKEMFSPSTANQFYTIAYELANQKDLSETNAMEAQIFFSAANRLESKSKYILEDMITLAARYTNQDNSEILNWQIQFLYYLSY